MKILVTGVAGFIGYHLIAKFKNSEHELFGIDNINNYYDTELKHGRLNEIGIFSEDIKADIIIKSRTISNFRFIKMDLSNISLLESIFADEKFDYVCNLAAQAGVRYSIENPHAYINSNINGFLNILECCRKNNIKHLVYASSSSVYGLNKKYPFSVKDTVDHPISLYAASKKSNELMAHSYSYLFNLPTTGLRFFTVYGPWGRPDMAVYKFTKLIYEGKTIDVYNFGKMSRDFTFIDDIIEGLVKVLFNPAKPNNNWNGLSPTPDSSVAPYTIYNIGNNKPVDLMDFIHCIEKELGKKAIINLLPIQPGDVETTWADTKSLSEVFDYFPNTPVEEGMKIFVDWFKNYYESINK